MRTLAALLAGLAGGALGELLRLPAGALLGAMLSVALVNLATDGALAIGRAARLPSRVLVGATIGSLATPSLLVLLGASIGWAVAVIALVVAAALGIGLLLARWGGLDRQTALLASCPGGIAEMAALADQQGARTEVVVGVHVVRKLVVVLAVVLGVAAL